MNEAFDKEIDSLLRRHTGAGAKARASDGSRAEARVGDGSRAAQSASHLDADELSAFAEGAMPAAARLAAVSHLADCDECRNLAVSLTSAAGVADELEKRAAPTRVEPARPARRLAWLSALFAPRVLRYAAPALALCLVAAVSFVAWRSRRSERDVARRVSNVGARPPAAARAGAGNESDEGAQVSPDANMSANSNLSVANSEPSNGETDEEAAARATGQSPRASQVRGPNAEGETPSVAAEEPKRAEAPPPPADEKSSAAGASPPVAKPGANEPTEVAKVEIKEKDDRASASQEQIAANDQPPQRQQQAKQRSNNLDIISPDDSRNQTRSTTNNASNGLTNNGSRAGSLASTPREERDRAERSGGATASRRARSEGESRAQGEDEDSARSEATRSAAGHRFRREGGAWVDVNYKSSMASTGVRRGTDTFRALVADIPEIGRVAEQLGGEVVVVVHGHAYHIR